jgi:hypothetical protein
VIITPRCVARQGPADAADIDQVGVVERVAARAQLSAQAVGADGDAAGDGLADRHDVGPHAPRGGAAARPGTDRVRLVDDQQRPRVALARTGLDADHGSVDETFITLDVGPAVDPTLTTRVCEFND